MRKHWRHFFNAMNENLKIQNYKVAELIPYVNNPRHNADAVDAVASSIAEFGFNVPCVIDKNKILVTGHTRLLAAKKLGLDSVPCIMADHLTDAQIKAFRLADNRVSELATWDTDLLASELEELADLNVDMSAFGFDEPEADPDDVDECEPEEEAAEEEETTTQRGQIYRLGRHFLMCGDSTDMGDVARLMAGELADLLLTDPPYNVGYEGKTADALTIQNDKMDDGQFYNFLLAAFKNAMAVMKDGAAYYIWYAAGESQTFFNAQKDSGLKLSEVLQWVKNVFTLGHYDYHWATESCLYGWKAGAPHYFVSERNHINVIQDDLNIDKMTREQLQDTCRMLLDVINTNALRENKPARNEQHPTMKPVKLFAKQIVNSSRNGDKILDLFAGSGTTIMACEQLDRTAYAMELDPIYCDRIIKRWEAQTGKHAELMP